MRLLTLLAVLLPSVALAHPHGPRAERLGLDPSGKESTPREPRPDATEHAEPWDDGLVPRAPRRAGGRLSWLGNVHTQQVHFLDLDGQLPLHASSRGTWSLGLDLVARATIVGVPSEGRPVGFQDRAMSLGLWFLFYGPKRTSHSAVVLTGGTPFSYETRHVRLGTHEAGGHLELAYNGYYTAGRWMAFSLHTQGGVNTEVIGRFSGSFSAIFTPPMVPLAVPLGIAADTDLGLWAMVGLRGRPVPWFEVGADVEIGLASAYNTPPQPVVLPGLRVKAWDGRKGRGAAAPWSAGLRRE